MLHLEVLLRIIVKHRASFIEWFYQTVNSVIVSAMARIHAVACVRRQGHNMPTLQCIGHSIAKRKTQTVHLIIASTVMAFLLFTVITEFIYCCRCFFLLPLLTLVKSPIFSATMCLWSDILIMLNWLVGRFDQLVG